MLSNKPLSTAKQKSQTTLWRVLPSLSHPCKVQGPVFTAVWEKWLLHHLTKWWIVVRSGAGTKVCSLCRGNRSSILVHVSGEQVGWDRVSTGEQDGGAEDPGARQWSLIPSVLNNSSSEKMDVLRVVLWNPLCTTDTRFIICRRTAHYAADCTTLGVSVSCPAHVLQ